MTKIIPIILAGGTGSRLWPLSRESFPKQFLDLIEEDKNTLLQKTYKRIQNIEKIPTTNDTANTRALAGSCKRLKNSKMEVDDITIRSDMPLFCFCSNDKY